VRFSPASTRQLSQALASCHKLCLYTVKPSQVRLNCGHVRTVCSAVLQHSLFSSSAVPAGLQSSFLGHSSPKYGVLALSEAKHSACQNAGQCGGEHPKSYTLNPKPWARDLALDRDVQDERGKGDGKEESHGRECVAQVHGRERAPAYRQQQLALHSCV
jgi:hypothetical protein